jgi:hypothetical protein
MKRRTHVALVTAVAFAFAALVAPSLAQADAKLNIVGKLTLKAGKSLKDNQRFQKRNKKIESGEEVRLTNKSKTQDPHSISVVEKNERPDEADEVFNCDACNALFGAHDPDGDGNPDQPVVDVGNPGFDVPGDSMLIGPPGSGADQVTFAVTAEPGTKLFYLCIFHPWMQGKFRVTEPA